MSKSIGNLRYLEKKRIVKIGNKALPRLKCRIKKDKY